MNNLISIIVTVYNREDFLEECLQSIKNQTYKNFEVIIIDDGSTDKSKEIALKFQNEDNRFKLIASEHIGFPLAKNLGLANVSGDYIIFLDSDDCAYPQWLELLYNAIVDTGADISTCYYDQFTNKKAEEPEANYFKSHPIYLAEYSFLKMNLIYHRDCSSYMWNKLIKRELYKDIVFKDQIALSDISVMYKIFDKANKVIQVQTPLVHYRRHMQSMGALTTSKGLEYYIFRASVLKESALFVWNHYPQSRLSIYAALKWELQRMIDKVGKDAFIRNIDCKEFHVIFKTPVTPYLFK